MRGRIVPVVNLPMTGLRGYVGIGTLTHPGSNEHVVLGEPLPGLLSSVPGGLRFTPDGDKHVLWAHLMFGRQYAGLYLGFWREDWTWLLGTPLWPGADRPYFGGGSTVTIDLEATTTPGLTWSLG
jgi:hypothetical protein